MTATHKWLHIPLAAAHLCLDCSEIGGDSASCPACASTALLSLAVVLDRKPTPQGKQWEPD
jgi:hypothetical protein